MRDVFHQRIIVFYIALFILMLIFVGKLFFVQIIDVEQFRAQGRSQYVAPASDVLQRGSIFFKKKDEELLGAATTQSGFLVALNPSKIDNPSRTYAILSEILPEIDKKAFFLKAGKKDDTYKEIAHHIDKERAFLLQAESLPGVNIYKEKWRLYPNGSLAAQVLGFVGFQGANFSGRYGVEKYYNDVLERKKNDMYVNFFARVFGNLEQSLFYNDLREGDVVLEIEPEVERFLEEILGEINKKWNTRGGGAIIINPKNGAIYAMAAYPTFNPNTFSEEEEYTVFSNPFVERVYEMGSIIKPLTLASGLDVGAITSESTYNDHGYVELNGTRIENYDGRARGVVPIQEILNQSLNTGAVYVMQKMGKEKFRKYFLNFGLGDETGIDIPGEIPGLVGNLNSPRDVEYATASFGQGIATTPIATVRALSSLANGGVLVTPHVVNRIDRKFGTSKIISYGGEKQVLKKETTEEITRMLVRVVDDALLGGTVKLPRYSIAAKTGTAQIARSDGGGYYEDKFFHAFFGYFPAYDPRFLVFFYAIEPQGVRYASQTLTKPFMDVVKFLINYYEIPPDR